MEPNLSIDSRRLAEFCRKWQVREFSLFGSVLREDFRPQSDVDVLVSFFPEAHPSLMTFASMTLELQEIFGRPVDLVEREGLEKSHNHLWRKGILSTARLIHAE